MNLTVELIEQDENYLLEVNGEIDIYTAPILKDALLPLTEESGKRVIVDLENVSYLDSTGLGIFISALKSTKVHNSRMELIHVRDRVYRLFNVTGLHEIMTLHKDGGGN